jgi:hypothetical protein
MMEKKARVNQKALFLFLPYQYKSNIQPTPWKIPEKNC